MIFLFLSFPNIVARPGKLSVSSSPKHHVVFSCGVWWQLDDILKISLKFIQIPGQEPQIPGQEPQIPGQEPQIPGQEPQIPGQEPQIQETNISWICFFGDFLRIRGTHGMKITIFHHHLGSIYFLLYLSIFMQIQGKKNRVGWFVY